jgi:predicted RNase H-like nuclease
MFWGIDGCKDGWIAVSLSDDDSITGQVYPSISTFWEHNKDTAKHVLIDIPIGLSDTQPRQVEALARQKLTGRSASVFPVPSRQVLEFAAKHNFEDNAYWEACDINEGLLGKRFSKQAWNILPKIYEVDAFLQENHSAQAMLQEAHPELLFWALNKQQPMRYSKKTGVGFTERVRLLEQHIPHVFEDITRLYNANKRVLVDDDIVDAIACALCAKLGDLTSLPNPPELDSTGLSMQMMYPQL